VKPVDFRVIQVLTLSGVIQCSAMWKHYNEYMCGVQLAGKGVKFKKTKFSLCEAMKPYSESRGTLHSFLTSALDVGR